MSAHYVAANVAKTVVGFKICRIVYVSSEILDCFFTLGKNVIANSLVPVVVSVSGPFGRELVVAVLESAFITNTVVVCVSVSVRYLLTGKNTVYQTVTVGVVPVVIVIVGINGSVSVYVLVFAENTLVICIPGVSCCFHSAVRSTVTAVRRSGVCGFVGIPYVVVDGVVSGTYYVTAIVALAVAVFVSVS